MDDTTKQRENDQHRRKVNGKVGGVKKIRIKRDAVLVRRIDPRGFGNDHPDGAGDRPGEPFLP